MINLKAITTFFTVNKHRMIYKKRPPGSDQVAFFLWLSYFYSYIILACSDWQKCKVLANPAT